MFLDIKYILRKKSSRPIFLTLMFFDVDKLEKDSRQVINIIINIQNRSNIYRVSGG